MISRERRDDLGRSANREGPNLTSGEAAVWFGIVGNAVWAGLAWLRQRFMVLLDRQDPRLRPISLLVLVVSWVAANLFVVERYAVSGVAAVALVVSGLAIWASHDLVRLWRVGIYGVDLQTKEGLDYETSLRLVSNSLDFLGTGASKLSEVKSFDEAIARCHRDGRPIRFLLLDPRSGADELTRAAALAGAGRNMYSTRVKESLRRIAHLARERQFNIEVRFYDTVQPFRLMFIDDSLCLFGYNVYGQGERFDHPQLHVVAHTRRRNIESYYHPLHEYFEKLWGSSTPWKSEEWE